MDLSKLQFAELPSELVTGVNAIDQQHVAIITIINHLSACAKEGQGREQLKNIIKFLDGYVTTHFNDEETYMAKYNYPNLKEHQHQHELFRKFVIDLKQKVESETQSGSIHINAITTLKKWIINHVTKVDILMAAYIKNSVQ